MPIVLVVLFCVIEAHNSSRRCHLCTSPWLFPGENHRLEKEIGVAELSTHENLETIPQPPGKFIARIAYKPFSNGQRAYIGRTFAMQDDAYKSVERIVR